MTQFRMTHYCVILKCFGPDWLSKISVDACMSFDDMKDISSPEMAKLNQAIQIATEKAVAEYYLALNGHKYPRQQVLEDERPKITWQNVQGKSYSIS